jgi:hypothetical protein
MSNFVFKILCSFAAGSIDMPTMHTKQNKKPPLQKVEFFGTYFI